MMASPFALYAIQRNTSRHSLVELDRSRFPRLTSLMCITETGRPANASQLNTSACVLIAPAQNGLAMWPPGKSRWDVNTTLVSLEGAAWRQMTGSILPCVRVEHFLSREEAAMTWCAILIGWDGKSVPIVVLPLRDGTLLPFVTSTIQPSLVVPLFSRSKRRDVVAMSFEVQRGHLWTISNRSELDVWDLFNAQSLGRSKLTWPTEAPKFKPRGVCESVADGGLFIIGASDTTGPLLFQMQLEDRFTTERIEPTTRFLPLQVL